MVHAAADWDWEMTGVTLVALFCAHGVLVAGRSDRALVVRRPVRLGLVACVVLAGAFAFVGLLSSSALSASEVAYAAGDLATAESKARTAMRWAPWSAAPLQRLGEAQLAAGRRSEAREQLRRAAAKAPADWSIQLNLAEANLPGAARRTALDRAAALNPRSPEVRLFKQSLPLRDAALKGAPEPAR
jgi:Flp pilus assembly protein TadD